MKMQHFVGTKLIMAMTMTRGAYNDYRGWVLPSDENGDDEGYLVEYVDGGQPNHPDHKGYISWSPKDVFEKSYLSIGDVGDIPAHQQRVHAEKAQLDEKLQKLQEFFLTDLFRGQPDDERNRLFQQAGAMRVYSELLGERISKF